MFGPARSPTKSPYRSAVKSLALEVEAPPIPPTVTDLCYHAVVSETEVSVICGSDTEPDCSGSIKGSFHAEKRNNWAFFGLRSRLNYKNFPVTITTVGGVPIYTIPFPCVPTEFPKPGDQSAFYVQTGSASYAYGIESLINPADCHFRAPNLDGHCTELSACSAVDFSSEPINTLVSARIQVASWGIQSINGPDVITVGYSGIWPGDHIAIKDTPGAVNNRGFVEVVGSNATQVFVESSAALQTQGAGGTIELIVAAWNRCRFYTSVGLPQSDKYPAQLHAGAGDQFDAIDTAFIRLSNAGIYSGDYQTIVKAVDHVELVGQNWTSRIENQGTWINKILKITAPLHSLGAGTEFGRIVGTVNYNGEYTFEYVDGDTLIVRNEWFVANESVGEIQYQIVIGVGDGLEAGFEDWITITVTGTTDYDGTWSVFAFEDLGDAFFYAGDFDLLWGTSFQSGSWVEVGGLGRSGVIDIFPNLGPDPITGFGSQRTGSIEIIDSDIMRIAVADAMGMVGGGVRTWSAADPVAYLAFEREIKGAGTDFIEAIGRFTVNDTGRLNIRDPY